MYSTLKVTGILLMVLMEIPLGTFQSSGRIKNIGIINDLSENLLNDPSAVIQGYYDFAEPFAQKSSFRSHILTSEKVYNLSLIDLRLLLNQSQEHFKVILEQHVQNTNPLMKTPLTVFMNSFLQVTYKMNNFISNANKTVNKALYIAGPEAERAMAKANAIITVLQNCSNANNLVSDINFVEEMQLCISKEITDFTIEFNSVVDHLSVFKSHFPDALVELSNCLLVDESMNSFSSVLNMTKCLGWFEDKRFSELYGIINKANRKINDLVTTIFRMATHISSCRTTAVENYNQFLENNNVTCSQS